MALEKCKQAGRNNGNEMNITYLVTNETHGLAGANGNKGDRNGSNDQESLRLETHM
jgi:hypothetical protein